MKVVPTPKMDTGRQALQSDPGASPPAPPPKDETVFGTIMVPSAAESDPTSATALSPGPPPPGTRPPATRSPRSGEPAAAPAVATSPAPRVTGDNRHILLSVWTLTVVLAAVLGALLASGSAGGRGGTASGAMQQELAAVQASVRALQTEYDRTRADLEDQVALLTAERDRLFTQHANLRQDVSRLRAPQAVGVAALRLGEPIEFPVEGASCILGFERLAADMPHLNVTVDVTNATPGILPGVMQLTVLDETLTEVGHANMNLFGEGAFEDLLPGQRRVAQGSIRIRAQHTQPAHFRLVFLR